jgi:hypothetical protein
MKLQNENLINQANNREDEYNILDLMGYFLFIGKYKDIID